MCESKKLKERTIATATQTGRLNLFAVCAPRIAHPYALAIALSSAAPLGRDSTKKTKKRVRAKPCRVSRDLPWTPAEPGGGKEEEEEEGVVEGSE